MTTFAPGRYVHPDGRVLTVQRVDAIWYGAILITVVDPDGTVRQVAPSVLDGFVRVADDPWAAQRAYAERAGIRWYDVAPWGET